MTAAHYAAQSDCAAAVELIMSLHMEDLVKRAGYIDSMAQAGQPVKADEIIEPDNIAIDRPSRSGATPLHVAACFDAKDAVNVLLRYNVNVSIFRRYFYAIYVTCYSLVPIRLMPGIQLAKLRCIKLERRIM